MSLPRSIVLSGLRRIRGGRIEIVEGNRRLAFGPPDADLAVTVKIRDPSAWRAFLRGSHGVADAYLAGAWECDDLVTRVRIGGGGPAVAGRAGASRTGRNASARTT